MKIGILTIRNKFSRRSTHFYPLIKWRKKFLELDDIKFSYFTCHEKEGLLNQDVVFIDSRYCWKLTVLDRKYDDLNFIKELINKLKRRKIKVLLFDNSDSTGGRYFELIDYVDLHIKKQLLKNRQKYTEDKGLYSYRVFLEGYDLSKEKRNQNINESYDYEPCALDQLHKIKLGWNIGLDDYRYFPEPDLPKLKISEIPEFAEDKLRSELPELPWEKRQRYLEIGLNPDQADFFVSNLIFADILNEVLEKEKNTKTIKLIGNYLSSDTVSLLKEKGESKIDNVSADKMISLVSMIKDGKISSRGAKDTLALMIETADDPQKIAEENNLIQQSDEGALQEIVAKIIADNPKVVEEYKGGKESALQFFIGQGMKETRGSANPQVLGELFKKNLG